MYKTDSSEIPIILCIGVVSLSMKTCYIAISHCINMVSNNGDFWSEMPFISLRFMILNLHAVLKSILYRTNKWDYDTAASVNMAIIIVNGWLFLKSPIGFILPSPDSQPLFPLLNDFY